MLRLPIAIVLTALVPATLLTSISDPAQARVWHRKYHSPKYMSRTWRRPAQPPVTGDRTLNVVIKVTPDAPGKAAAPVVPDPPKRPLKLLTREEILASDPDRLERLGRRLIVGYQFVSEAKALVEKRAIAGVFITDRNVRGRKIADVAAEIKSLQDIRKAQGLPRLIVAADQEGGYVSRLSPPLKWQPSLSMLIAPLKSDDQREKAVRDFAEKQARELESLGVTMNFGPVVDLRLGTPDRNDGETRLYWRAIDSDPYLVAKVAAWYCDTLTKFNIICTLKHFPGLGRVTRDTHVATGELTASESKVEMSDWVPFRRVMTQPGVATMVGHVRVGFVDNVTPASYSDAVINKILRSRWQDDGLLVTDDFSMGAIINSKDGIGGAAVKALNAGVDLILVSFTEQHFDTVMSALIEADAKGEINSQRRDASRERLAKYVFVDDKDPVLPPQQAQQAPSAAPTQN